MKRKPKKPLHSRLVRKWDGTDLVPELPVPPAAPSDQVEASVEVEDLDQRPLGPRVPTLEDLFDDEEVTSEHDS